MDSGSGVTFLQEVTQGANKLSILVLSDIHLAFDQLRALKLWINEHRNSRTQNKNGDIEIKPHYDCVLIPGDIACVNHN